MSKKETIWLVLDTNAYLHYNWFEDIPWSEILKEKFGIIDKHVGIGIPCKVIQELSDKKDSARGKIQKRAKKISSVLGDVFLNGKDLKLPILQIPLPADTDFDDLNFHPSNNDDVIILSVMKWVNASTSIIVSGDNPFLIKAKDNNMRFYRIEDKYLLNEELTDEEKTINELKRELEAYKNRISNIKMLFDNNTDLIEIQRNRFKQDDKHLLDAYKEELERLYPYKRKPSQDEAYNNPLAVLHNSDYFFSAESFNAYNKDRDKYINDSLHKKKLEIIADRQKQTYKELLLYIDNSMGTSSSGKINIELHFPANIELYGNPVYVSYDKPNEPQLGNNSNLQSIAIMALYGHPNQSKIKLWNDDCIINEHTLRFECDNLNHHMKRLLNTRIWIDTSKCHSFAIKWMAIDSDNPNIFQGELHVIIK